MFSTVSSIFFFTITFKSRALIIPCCSSLARRTHSFPVSITDMLELVNVLMNLRMIRIVSSMGFTHTTPSLVSEFEIFLRIAGSALAALATASFTIET